MLASYCWDHCLLSRVVQQKASAVLFQQWGVRFFRTSVRKGSLFQQVFQYKQNNHFERKCWRYEGVDIGCVGSSSSLQKSRRTAPAAQAFHVSSEVLKAKMTCRMPIGRLVLCVTESFPFIKPKGPYLVTHVDHFCLSDYDDRGCVCVCNCVYLLVT